MQIKLIFTRKVVHLASFWKWGFLELGSGLLICYIEVANEVCKQANDVLLCMKMILLEIIVVFLISLVQVHPSVCSHFRGGTFTYKPVDPSNPANTTVSFRDQAMQRVCTMSTIHGNFSLRLHFCLPAWSSSCFQKRGNAVKIGFYWLAKRLSLGIEYLQTYFRWPCSNVQVNVHKMHPFSVHKLPLTYSFSSRSVI